MGQIMENARGRELIDALDQERRKVEAFRRELPLCLQLIDQTIESYKKMMVGGDELAVELSLRPAGSSIERDPPPVAPEKPAAMGERKKCWEKALDLEKEDQEHGNESSHGEEEIRKGSSRRKARRFWSEELHKMFTHALEQLGGCDAATPKHIRKLMKVDGLTNDEVKSHLQKFRLHARRSGQGMQYCNSSNPQLVVAVRGIWTPSPDRAPVVTSTAPAAVDMQAETGRHHQAPLLHSPVFFLNRHCQQQQKAN